MELTDYRPRPKLVVKETRVARPKFPVVDAHNHLSLFGPNWEERPLPELLQVMDQAGVRVVVDLDGGWGEDILRRHLKKFKEPAPERFKMYAGVNWNAWADQGMRFPDWAAERLRVQAHDGAEGLKIWKPLGLSVKDHRGSLVSVNDTRLDVIWQTAAELHLPVLIHVADPVAFFDPVDEHNERYEELHAHPDWQFTSPPFPPFQQVVDDLQEMVVRNRQTTFIGAHAGCYPEHLDWVGRFLDRCPNFHVDIAQRIAELGRQPYTARRFFLKYADRILFGTDVGPDVDTYRIYYRFLETDDENFAYSDEEIPLQGRWRIHGLYLPDDVLEKVYLRNAERIVLERRV